MVDETDDWRGDDSVHPDDEPPRGKAPVVIAIASVVAVLVVVGLVGFLVSRAGPSGKPTSEMTPTQAPLKLELPVTVGDLARDPNVDSSTKLGEGEEQVEARSATFVRDRTDSLYVVIARPMTDAQEMLALLDARAIREVGDGYCGRDSSDLDVCAVIREDIGILAAGLEGQTPEAIVEDATEIGAAIERE
ncbi:hypothetical protein [Enemella sp. A6]|uniref:hypothetical protein n=1 Tax=Enemella sp. A6 TaxID=3440152 RepID=UPI003EB7EAD5